MADRLRGVTRRELLKLSPLLGLGAFACRHGAIACSRPVSRGATRRRGCCFAEIMPALASCGRRRAPRSISVQLLRRARAGPRPRHWALKVGGAVARPGSYTPRSDSCAAEGHAEHAPRLRRRLGRHGPLRRRAARRFSRDGRRGPERAISDGDVRGRLLRVARHRDRASSAVAALLRDVRPPARRAGTARRFDSACPPRSATSTRNTS